jgi:hypothetical protein
MPICEYCKYRKATHFCRRCGHWVCSAPQCLARAAARSAGKILSAPLFRTTMKLFGFILVGAAIGAIAGVLAGCGLQNPVQSQSANYTLLTQICGLAPGIPGTTGTQIQLGCAALGILPTGK